MTSPDRSDDDSQKKPRHPAKRTAGGPDLGVLSRISQAIDLPVNAIWLPEAPSPADLFKAGVARVSGRGN